MCKLNIGEAKQAVDSITTGVSCVDDTICFKGKQGVIASLFELYHPFPTLCPSLLYMVTFKYGNTGLNSIQQLI